jgi:hypothetical protein
MCVKSFIFLYFYKISKIVRLADLAKGVLTKILQKWHFTKIMKKNNFVNNNQTDKNCQYPTGEGLQCANGIDYL